MTIKKTDIDGKVVLISGGDKVYTDIAARFVGSERNLEEIIGSPYDKKIVKNIIESGHEACTEFDWFIFGVEGYSRVTEVQLVRKRIASYMIKSGRVNKNGKRSYDVVVPEDIMWFVNEINLEPKDIEVNGKSLSEILPNTKNIKFKYDGFDLLKILESWYNEGIEQGLPEEDLRYLKPQATEFKGLIGMNSHSLRDWFRIRCCMNAQHEIRDLANKILKLCKKAAPDLFEDAGANCVRLGYCPENKNQHPKCKDKIYTKKEALSLLKKEK